MDFVELMGRLREANLRAHEVNELSHALRESGKFGVEQRVLIAETATDRIREIYSEVYDADKS